MIQLNELQSKVLEILMSEADSRCIVNTFNALETHPEIKISDFKQAVSDLAELDIIAKCKCSSHCYKIKNAAYELE